MVVVTWVPLLWYGETCCRRDLSAGPVDDHAKMLLLEGLASAGSSVIERHTKLDMVCACFIDTAVEANSKAASGHAYVRPVQFCMGQPVDHDDHGIDYITQLS